MNKTVRRVLALFLALLMALSLSACSMFSGRAAICAAKMSKVKSLRMDLYTDLRMSMSLFGEAMNLDMSVTGPLELTTSPMKAGAELRVEMLGEALKLLSYTERSGSSQVVYYSADQGKSWQKQALDTAGFSAGGGLDMKSIAGIAKLGANFEETGLETVKGSEAIVYQGSISVADLRQIIDFSAVLAAAEKSSGLSLEESDFDFDSVAPIPLTLCISKRGSMLVRYAVDLTGLAQAILPVVVQAAVKNAMAQSPLSGIADTDGADLSTLGIDFNLSRLVVASDLYDFDAVADITIPPEALAAETAAP